MLFDQIQEAVSYIRSVTSLSPRFGIILGTGLGNLVQEVVPVAEIPYSEIPHFPVSTVKSHKSRLVLGLLNDIPVAVMAGRFHYYEGYTGRQITFPVRVLASLGIERLFLSNAAGSVNAAIEAGDLVFLRDHINFQPDNPLRGENDERLGPRFPDMLHTYDRSLNERALAIANRHGIRAHEGVYLCLPGPNLETPAEYGAFHIMGADLIGMSTVPEVIVARHMNLPVFAASVATNKCYPTEEIKPTTVDDVIAVAQKAEADLRVVVKELMKELATPNP